MPAPKNVKQPEDHKESREKQVVRVTLDDGSIHEVEASRTSLAIKAEVMLGHPPAENSPFDNLAALYIAIEKPDIDQFDRDAFIEWSDRVIGLDHVGSTPTQAPQAS